MWPEFLVSPKSGIVLEYWLFSHGPLGCMVCLLDAWAAFLSGLAVDWTGLYTGPRVLLWAVPLILVSSFDDFF